MKKFIFVLLASIALCSVCISCSSGDGSESEETHYTYDVVKAKTAFYNAVASLTEEFMIEESIAARSWSIKSDFFKSYPKSDYSSGYVLYGWNLNNGQTIQYRKDIIVTFNEKTGYYSYRTY